MIYKFKSKAAGDLIMLQPHGDQLMRLIGREPAPKGIIETADMPAAMQALQQAAAQAQAPSENGEGERGVQRGAAVADHASAKPPPMAKRSIAQTVNCSTSSHALQRR